CIRLSWLRRLGRIAGRKRCGRNDDGRSKSCDSHPHLTPLICSRPTLSWLVPPASRARCAPLRLDAARRSTSPTCLASEGGKSLWVDNDVASLSRKDCGRERRERREGVSQKRKCCDARPNPSKPRRI